MTISRAAAVAVLLAATVSATVSAPVSATCQTLAATPPMGWNSWNHFAGRVTDADVRGAADALVSSGMRDAGYVYVNIDDTWEAGRDAQGNILTNEKFPDMKALSDYVHSKGLKLGIYSSPGSKTCARFEGSLHHEDQDAKTYAAWGIDYLKYDLCGLYKDAMNGKPLAEQHRIMVDAYQTMDKALKGSGRPIVYSLCQYGNDAVWEWGTNVGGNLWRTTGDINDKYDTMARIGFSQAGLAKYAGPGHWNDPDMLEVGNGGMNSEEYRTHMALWAILAAPLLAGNDLSKMTPETVAILTNRDVVAVDQDKLGQQGDRVYAEGPIEVWSRTLADGSKAVGVFNRAPSPIVAHVDFRKMGIAKVSKARDLWLGKDLGALEATMTPLIPAHGVLLLRVSK
jgi:alpha-galactosidase